jgi:hypothetical protein
MYGALYSIVHCTQGEKFLNPDEYSPLSRKSDKVVWIIEHLSVYNFFVVVTENPALGLKGTVSRDFLLQVFCMDHFLPSPWLYRLGPFQIFSKICGDIRSSRCTTGVNNTGS